MKTLEEIQAEMTCGDVFTLERFKRCVEKGVFIPYDGSGYFHDGEAETNISVWDNSLTWNDIKDYPYVCWYNK